MLVSIDPGLRQCGVAVFDGGKLVDSRLIKNPEKKLRGPAAWRSIAREVCTSIVEEIETLVLEVPQVYSARFSKGDPADLIELAGVDGALTMGLKAEEIYSYLPRIWKGQVPKDLHNKRIEKLLAYDEKARVVELPKSLRHNVIDAIGLGLFHLKRL